MLRGKRKNQPSRGGYTKKNSCYPGSLEMLLEGNDELTECSVLAVYI
jgi:hypothetical protein